MDTEDVIRRMLACLLPSIAKRVVLFLFGNESNCKLVADELANYPLSQYSLVLSGEASECVGQETVKRLNATVLRTPEDIDEALRRAELVLIPVVTRGVLSKVALGIQDDPPTEGIARALMLGKEVIAIRDEYDPAGVLQIRLGLTMNLAYNAMLSAYEERLQEFGVQVIDLYEFKATVSSKLDPLRSFSYTEGSLPQSRRLEAPAETKLPEEAAEYTMTGRAGAAPTILTLADVERLYHTGQSPADGDILTPLAREFLQSAHGRVREEADTR